MYTAKITLLLQLLNNKVGATFNRDANSADGNDGFIPTDQCSLWASNSAECNTADAAFDVESPQNYRGCVNKSRQNFECAAWDSNPTDSVWTTEEKRTANGLTQNYCRDPADADTGAESKGQLWCYTTDATVGWDYCNPRGCQCDWTLFDLPDLNYSYADSDAEEPGAAYNSSVTKEAEIECTISSCVILRDGDSAAVVGIDPTLKIMEDPPKIVTKRDPEESLDQDFQIQCSFFGVYSSVRNSQTFNVKTQNREDWCNGSIDYRSFPVLKESLASDKGVWLRGNTFHIPYSEGTFVLGELADTFFEESKPDDCAIASAILYTNDDDAKWTDNQPSIPAGLASIKYNPQAIPWGKTTNFQITVGYVSFNPLDVEYSDSRWQSTFRDIQIIQYASDEECGDEDGDGKSEAPEAMSEPTFTSDEMKLLTLNEAKDTITIPYKAGDDKLNFGLLSDHFFDLKGNALCPLKHCVKYVDEEAVGEAETPAINAYYELVMDQNIQAGYSITLTLACSNKVIADPQFSSEAWTKSQLTFVQEADPAVAAKKKGADDKANKPQYAVIAAGVMAMTVSV